MVINKSQAQYLVRDDTGGNIQKMYWFLQIWKLKIFCFREYVFGGDWRGSGRRWPIGLLNVFACSFFFTLFLCLIIAKLASVVKLQFIWAFDTKLCHNLLRNNILIISTSLYCYSLSLFYSGELMFHVLFEKKADCVFTSKVGFTIMLHNVFKNACVPPWDYTMLCCFI